MMLPPSPAHERDANRAPENRGPSQFQPSRRRRGCGDVRPSQPRWRVRTNLGISSEDGEVS